jgi:hypothetical protein
MYHTEELTHCSKEISNHGSIEEKETIWGHRHCLGNWFLEIATTNQAD